jgi:hypothetical protein
MRARSRHNRENGAAPLRLYRRFTLSAMQSVIAAQGHKKQKRATT